MKAGTPWRAISASSVVTGTRLVLVQVDHSRAELDQVRSRLASDQAWQRAVAPVESSNYIDVAHNQVAVGVTQLTQAEELAKATGAKRDAAEAERGVKREALRRADRALYKAKSSGREGYAFYTQELTEFARHAGTWVKDADPALIDEGGQA